VRAALCVRITSLHGCVCAYLCLSR
jgi:hypothetical protein